MYCKENLLKELKQVIGNVKTQDPFIPDGWTGKDRDFNNWAQDLFNPQPPKKELRKTSEQY